MLQATSKLIHRKRPAGRTTAAEPGQKQTSIEWPETNTLSVGEHPCDGESVEAKGMPK
jgi:hypothetical protein